MTEILNQTTGSQGKPEAVTISSVLKETNEIVLKWADGFMAKYPLNFELKFQPAHGQLCTGHFIGSRLIGLDLAKEPAPAKPVLPVQNPIKQPEPVKEPVKQEPVKPTGKDWQRSGKIIKIGCVGDETTVKLSWKDYKTKELKETGIILPPVLKQKASEFRDGDWVTIHITGNTPVDIVRKTFDNTKGTGQVVIPPQKPTITIGGTINLQNYENIRIEISGTFETQDDITRYVQTLKETALQFGKDEITQGFVRNYVKRTFGE